MMEFTTDRDELLDAVRAVEPAAGGSGTVPILTCALIECADRVATVTCTDLELRIARHIEVALAVPGAVALPVRALKAALTGFPKGCRVSVSVSGDVATLAAVGMHAAINTWAACEFPLAKLHVAGARFAVDAATLAGMLTACKHSISKEETRYYLNGVYLHVVKGQLRAVATDGHTLTSIDAPLPAGAEAMPTRFGPFPGIIIPRATVDALIRFLRKRTGSIAVSVGNNVLFSAGSTEIMTKVIDGKFPDYSRHISQAEDCDRELVVTAAEFGALIRNLAKSVSKEANQAVVLDLAPDRCRVSAKAMDGVGSAPLNGSTRYTGKALRVGFQARYLAAFCDAAEGEMRIAMGESHTAARLTSDRAGWLGVLMPIRV